MSTNVTECLGVRKTQQGTGQAWWFGQQEWEQGAVQW